MRIRFVLTFFHPFCECLGTFSIFFFSNFLFLFSKRSVFLLYSLFLIINEMQPHPQPLLLVKGRGAVRTSLLSKLPNSQTPKLPNSL